MDKFIAFYLIFLNVMNKFLKSFYLHYKAILNAVSFFILLSFSCTFACARMCSALKLSMSVCKFFFRTLYLRAYAFLHYLS